MGWQSIYRAENMFGKSVPDRLLGVWKRLSLEEDGDRDTTSQVFWLQTNSCFGDIRIPANRPAIGPQVQSLDDLSEQQAIALSHQDGFAGITRMEDNTCEWLRSLDYRPFTGKPDVGYMHWEGDLLVEIGPDDAYTEEWQRVATGPTAALTLSEGASWRGWLAICGDRFIYTRDRRQTLPAAACLTALLTQAAAAPHGKNTDWSARKHYLDCEISYGQCQSGRVPWEIELSTLPWKEGTSLWQPEALTLDSAQSQLVHERGAHRTIWTVQERGNLAQLIATTSDRQKFQAGSSPTWNASC